MKHVSRKSAAAALTMALLAGSMLAPATAHAATWYWDTLSGSWGTSANWSSNATSGGTTGTPAAGDTLTFSQGSVNGAEIVTLDAARTTAGITFANTGTTTINSGAGTNSLTLGTGALTVNSGAGAVTINVAMAVSAWSVVNNSANAITFNGLVDLNNSTYTVDSGTGLVVFNSFTTNGGNTDTFNADTIINNFGLRASGDSSRNVTFAGSGNITISGLNNGTIVAANAPTLNYAGTGTFSMTGNNYLNNTGNNGAVNVNTGTLGSVSWYGMPLNVAATTVVGGSSVLTMGVGGDGGAAVSTQMAGTTTLSVATRTTDVAFAGTTLNPGFDQIIVADNAAANAVVLGPITRNAGAGVVFAAATGNNQALPANTLLTTSTPNANFAGGQQTILGGWAINRHGAGGSWDANWVTNNGTEIAQLVPTGTFGAGNDVSLTANVTTTVTTSLTINSLKMTGAVGSPAVAINAGQTLTIATGGILEVSAGADAHNISGPGNITSGNGQDLIWWHNEAGNPTVETISANITGNIGFTLESIYGSLNMTLSGTNTYTGDTNLIAAYTNTTSVILGNSAALQNSALNYANLGATLSFGTLASATIGGLKGAESLALTNAAAAAVALTIGSSTMLSTSPTYSGILSGTGSTVLKTGSNTQVFSGANTYTGGTTVSQGVLALTNTTGSGTGTGPVVVNSPGALGGNGIINSGGNTITIAGGLAPHLGTGLSTATLTVTTSAATGVAFNSGVNLNYAFGNSGVSDLLQIAGALTLNLSGAGQGTITFNAVNGATYAANNTYTLVTASSIAGFNAGYWNVTGSALAANALSGSVSQSGNSLILTLAPLGTPYTWTGQNNHTWDTTTTNWKLTNPPNTATTYAEPSQVTFDDTGTNTTGIVIVGSGSGTVSPVQTTFTNTSAVSYSFASGAIAGAGKVMVNSADGTGTVTFSNSNTYSGGTTLQSGTLVANNVGALGSTSGVVTLSGGTLDLATDTSVNAYNITVGGNAAIVADRATAGAGITHALGMLSIGGYQLNVAAGSHVSSGTAGVTFGATTLGGAATLRLGAGTLVTLGTVANGANTLTLTGAGSFAQAGAIGSGSGGLALDANFTGSATLSQSNLYTGPTTVQNGTLVIGVANAIPTGTMLTLGSATSTGTLDLGGFAQQLGGLASAGGAVIGSSSATANSTLTLNSATSNTFGGTIENSLSGGTKSVTLAINAGTLTLSGANTYTGATTVGAGTLALTGSLGNTSVSVHAAGALTTGDGTTVSIAGPVTIGSDAAGGILTPHTTSGGFGNLTVSNALSLNGSTLNFNFGAPGGTSNDMVTGITHLTLGGTSTLNVLGQTGFAMGTYELFGYSGSLTGTTANLVVGSIPNGLFNYTISTATDHEITLIVAAKPSLTWTAGVNSTWSTASDADWNNGSGPVAFTQNSPVLFNNDGLSLANRTITLSGTLNPVIITVTTGTAYAFTGSGNLGDYSGGTTPLVKNGTGTLTMNAATANTYSGGTTINGGKLQIATAGALGATSGGLTINDTGTLEVTDNISSARGIALGTGNPAILVDASKTYTASGTISGVGNLNAIGTGTLALSGANNFSGQTIIQSGKVTVGTLATAGTAQPLGTNAQPVVIGGSTPFATTNATLGFSGATTSTALPVTIGSGGGAIAVTSAAATLTVTGAVSGGALTATGPGTLSLAGTNSYTGGTSITGGTVQTVNSNGLGSGRVTLSGGSTLHFTNTTLGAAVALPTASAAWATSSSWNNGSQDPSTVANGSNWWQVGANAAGGAQPDFVLVDLGANYNLSQITINWHEAAVTPSVFAFYTAPAGTAGLYTSPLNTNNPTVALGGATQPNVLTLAHWTLDSAPFTTAANATGNFTYNLNGVSGEYLALYVTARNPGNGYGLNINQITINGYGAVSQSISSLSSSDPTTQVVLDSNVTLTVGSDNTSTTFAGAISGGSGAALVKTGSGTLTLSHANTYAGGTTINTGALAVANTTGSGTGSGPITVSGAGTLAGSGSVNTGANTVSVAGTIAPTYGNGLTTSTLSMATTAPSGVTFNSGTNLNFNFGNAGVSDLLSITGALTLGLNAAHQGTVTFNQISGSSYALGSQYTLVTASSISGFNPAYWDVSGAAPGGFTPVLSQTGNALLLTLTVPVTWYGQTNSTWDTATTNWKYSSDQTTPSIYVEPSAVTFDDHGAAHPSVQIVAGGVNPASTTFSNSGAVSYTISGGAIGGNGPVAITGGGTVTLSNANTYSGGTLIQNGTLIVGASNALPVGGTITIGSAGHSGKLDLRSNNQTVGGLATAGNPANQIITNNGLGDATLGYAGGASTFGGMIEDGSTNKTLLSVSSGSLTLGGNSNYSGATTVSGGTLTITGALANTAMGVTGGTLALNATGAVSGSTVTISGTGALTEGAANALSGTAALTVAGGSATLSMTNSYTGATSVSGGTLTVTGSLGNSVVTVSAGSLGLNATAAVSQNTITVSGTGTLIESAPNALAGSAGLSVTAGTATLTQANNYAGATSVSGGTLNLAAAGAISQSTLTVSGAGTLNAATANGLAGTAALVVNGAAVTLANANNYTGGTVLAAGTLLVSNTTGSATGTGTVTLNGGTLASATTGLIGGSLMAGSGAHSIAPGGLGSAGTLSVGGDLTLNSQSTLAFDVSTGATDLLAIGGNLNVTGGPATLALTTTGTLSGNYVLATFNSTSATVSSFNVTGLPTGFALVVDAGDLTLAQDIQQWQGTDSTHPTYWDINTTVNWRGSASLTPSKYQDGYAVLFDDKAAGTTTVDITTTVSPALVTMNNLTKAYSFIGPGKISGSASLLVAGGGMVTLANTGGNDFTGGTTIQNGTLVLGVANALPAAGAITVSGGILDLGGLSQTLTTGTAHFQGGTVQNGTLASNTNAFDAQSGTVSATLSGAAGLTKSSTGTFTLSGTANYTGATTVTAGNMIVTGVFGNTPINVSGGTLTLSGAAAVNQNTLTVSGTGALAQTAPNSISGGTALAVTGGSATLSQANNYTGETSVSGGILTLSAAGAVSAGTISVSGTGALNGNAANALGGSAALSVTGGTATLSQANNYTGSTSVSGGQLALNGAGAISQNTLTVSGAGVLTVGAANAVSGSTALVVTGGTATLGAGNNYIGNTTVSGGTLAATNLTGSATGPGTVTLNGGTLASGATGTISGAVLAGSGAYTIAPGGVGSVGTLNLTAAGGLTLTAHSTLSIDVTSAGADLLAISGALAVSGGPANLAFTTTGTLNGNYTVATFASTTAAAGDFTVTGVPTGYVLRFDPGDITLLQNVLRWVGGDATHPTFWDINTTSNWYAVVAGATAKYTDGQAVRFDDTAAGTTVNITTTVAPGTILFNNLNDAFTVNGSGKISGTAELLVTGGGSVTLGNTGGNNFSGGTVVQNGTLTLGLANALPTAGAITLGAVGGTGVLNLGGFSQSTSGAVSFQGGTLQNGTLAKSGAAYDGQSGIVSAVLSGGVGLNKTTAGTLTLAAANNFSGAVSVTGGVLAITNNAALGTGAVTVNGGTLDLGGRTVANAITINGAGAGGNGALISSTGNASVTNTLTVGSASSLGGDGNLTVNALSSSQANTGMPLTKVGNGTLTFAGAASNSNPIGPLTVNAGTAVLAAPSAAATHTINNPALVNNSAIVFVTINAGGTLQLGGSYSGTPPTQAAGAPNYVDQIFDYGDVMLAGGTLDFAGTSEMFNHLVGAGDLVPATGVVTNSASGTVSEMITLGSFAFAGTIQDGPGGGQMSVLRDYSNSAGPFTLTLTGTNTYTGATAIQVGNLALDAAGAINASPITISSNSLGGAALSETADNALTGTASLTLSAGTGSVAPYATLSNANNYTGATSVGAGTLLLSAPGAIAASAVTVTGTGTLLEVADDALSGSTSLALNAPGSTLTLSHPNNYAGGTTVTAGTLVVGDPAALGTGALTLNGGLTQIQRGITSPTATVVLSHLVLAGGTLDITDNRVLIQSATDIRQTIRNAVINASLTTSVASTPLTPGATTTIGYLSGADYTALSGLSSFAGAPVSPDDIVVRWTYAGDIDLDGVVDQRDFRLMDAGYLGGFDGTTRIASWENGDVDHNGRVDASDFALAVAALDGTPLGQQMYALYSSEFGSSFDQAFAAAVPEPASLMLLGLGAAGLLARRRRQ